MRAIHFYLSFSIQPNTTTHKPKKKKKRSKIWRTEQWTEDRYLFVWKKKTRFLNLRVIAERIVCLKRFMCASGQRQRPNSVHILLFLYILFHYYLFGRRHYNVQTNVTLNLMAERRKKKTRWVFVRLGTAWRILYQLKWHSPAYWIQFAFSILNGRTVRTHFELNRNINTFIFVDIISLTITHSDSDRRAAWEDGWDSRDTQTAKISSQVNVSRSKWFARTVPFSATATGRLHSIYYHPVLSHLT